MIKQLITRSSEGRTPIKETMKSLASWMNTSKAWSPNTLALDGSLFEPPVIREVQVDGSREFTDKELAELFSNQMTASVKAYFDYVDDLWEHDEDTRNVLVRQVEHLNDVAGHNENLNRMTEGRLDSAAMAMMTPYRLVAGPFLSEYLVLSYLFSVGVSYAANVSSTHKLMSASQLNGLACDKESLQVREVPLALNDLAKRSNALDPLSSLLEMVTRYPLFHVSGCSAQQGVIFSARQSSYQDAASVLFKYLSRGYGPSDVGGVLDYTDWDVKRFLLDNLESLFRFHNSNDPEELIELITDKIHQHVAGMEFYGMGNRSSPNPTSKHTELASYAALRKVIHDQVKFAFTKCSGMFYHSSAQSVKTESALICHIISRMGKQIGRSSKSSGNGFQLGNAAVVSAGFTPSWGTLPFFGTEDNLPSLPDDMYGFTDYSFEFSQKYPWSRSVSDILLKDEHLPAFLSAAAGDFVSKSTNIIKSREVSFPVELSSYNGALKALQCQMLEGSPGPTPKVEWLEACYPSYSHFLRNSKPLSIWLSRQSKSSHQAFISFSAPVTDDADQVAADFSEKWKNVVTTSEEQTVTDRIASHARTAGLKAAEPSTETLLI